MFFSIILYIAGDLLYKLDSLRGEMTHELEARRVKQTDEV